MVIGRRREMVNRYLREGMKIEVEWEKERGG